MKRIILFLLFVLLSMSDVILAEAPPYEELWPQEIIDEYNQTYGKTEIIPPGDVIIKDIPKSVTVVAKSN